jgi:hypothetical protein
MSLSVEYFLLVFWASCGLLQGVFTYRRLRGLQFFPVAWLSYVFSAVALVGSFAWFYATDDRNVLPVLEGSQQFGFFLAGVSAAVAFTLITSSLMNWPRRLPKPPEGGESSAGLDDLKGMTYLHSLVLLGREMQELRQRLLRWKRRD